MSGFEDGAGDAASGLMLGWFVWRVLNRAPRRVAAFGIDCALIAMVAWIADRFTIVPEPLQWTMLLVPYRIAGHSLFQATAAKRLLGLRVVYEGGRVPLARSVLREVPLVVIALWLPVLSVMPLPLSLEGEVLLALGAITLYSAWMMVDALAMAQSPAAESSLHDRLAGTRVVHGGS